MNTRATILRAALAAGLLAGSLAPAVAAVDPPYVTVTPGWGYIDATPLTFHLSLKGEVAAFPATTTTDRPYDDTPFAELRCLPGYSRSEVAASAHRKASPRW